MGTERKKRLAPQHEKATRGPDTQGGAPPRKQPKHTKDGAKKDPAEPPLPRLDPKSVGYFRRVGDTLQQDFESDEDRGLFIRNVFNEVQGNELALATDMSGSIVLQKLLAVATSAQLCQMLAVLRENWQAVCWHRSGAHVIETALLRFPQLQNQQETEEDEAGEDTGPGCSLEELVLSLGAEVKEKFLEYNQNVHGSFIVRTLFQVLSGVILNPESNKRKGGQALAVKSEFEAPETFLEQLQDLCGCFADHVGVFATHRIASLGMQVALQVLHRKVPSACAKLCDQVIEYLSSRNVQAESSSLLMFLKDEKSSRLLERILEVSDKKQLLRVYRIHFKGQLETLSCHPIANYTVQRLISATRTKKMFISVFDELCEGLENILAKGHMGIITTLAEGCKRLKRRQSELLSQLMEAFHCVEPTSRQAACVPLFLSLLTYEIYYAVPEDDDEAPAEHQISGDRKLESLNYHGSLLVQHLLHFEDPLPALNSLGSMTEVDLLTIACNQAGSHIFDAMLGSATITDKQRKKVLRKLRVSAEPPAWRPVIREVNVSCAFLHAPPNEWSVCRHKLAIYSIL
uniref:NOP9 nucleolar protein n=1 Tax=Leptobrachium leishanense TaxID=445787 RepID=A0A8C5MJ80_9ANUR